MLTLKEFMELVDYRITEGSDYWPEGGLQGRQLYSLSTWNGDYDGWSFNIGFDTKDQRVYVVEVCDYKHDRAYRLVDSDLKKADNTAWDGVDYVDLEEDDDFIQKALAIKAGEDYDTRVSVPITLPDDAMFELMKQAHSRDITFNQLVEEVLWTAIRAEEAKDLNDTWDDDDDWDKIAEDHWEDDGDEMLSDLQEFKPAPAMKAKKKKKSK